MSEIPQIVEAQLKVVRYSQSNVSPHFSKRKGEKRKEVLGTFIDNLPALVTVELDEGTFTSMDNRRRRHYEHHQKNECNILNLSYELSIRGYLKNLRKIQEMGESFASISTMPLSLSLLIGYYDKDNADLVLFSWDIDTVGKFIQARCLLQEDDFPINGRVSPPATVNNSISNYAEKILKLEPNEREPPKFSEIRSTLVNFIVGTLKEYKHNDALSFPYKFRTRSILKEWLLSRGNENTSKCYTFSSGNLTEELKEFKKKEVLEFNQSNYESDFPAIDQSPSKIGKSTNPSNFATSPKGSSQSLSSEDVDNIIQQALFEDILENYDDGGGDLASMYLWTKGSMEPSLNNELYTVTDIESYEVVPNGGSFKMTYLDVITLNDAWNNQYPDEEYSESNCSDFIPDIAGIKLFYC